MENQKKMCSLKKHSNFEAISYCKECRKYLCNKCQKYHSELFEDHNLINLNKNLNKIFIDICNDHKNKLEFFCKTHNKLCCLGCISKIKEEGFGQHTDCNVCHIKKLKNEKWNKLQENIKYLHNLDNVFEKSLNKLKNTFEEINEKKVQLKLKISKIFTEIRNLLNEKEDELLLQINEKYNIYIKEDIIKESQNIPKQIKILLENGKIIDKEWNDNNLSSYINDCINIEDNVKKIKLIEENIIKCNFNKNVSIDFILKEETISDFKNRIKNLGEIISKENIFTKRF